MIEILARCTGQNTLPGTTRREGLADVYIVEILPLCSGYLVGTTVSIQVGIVIGAIPGIFLSLSENFLTSVVDNFRPWVWMKLVSDENRYDAGVLIRPVIHIS